MEIQQTNFQKMLTERVQEAEALIQKYLPIDMPKGDENYVPKTMVDAMNYSVLAGGKRLRPIMMLEMYRIFGGTLSAIEPFAAAIEMIHTYSLVHDDLPAMDNDEYRRGKKTTWAVYGDAMGVLAGDGLLNYAFETAASAFDVCRTAEDYARVAAAMKILARNAGIYGMIGGQVADMEAEDAPADVTKEQLLYIHTHKTGALIQAAMMVGAVLAGASEEALVQIAKSAMNIGVAFQIQDDVLDVIGDSKELGKPIGSDAANGKQTYVTLVGLDASKEEVRRLSEEAVELIKSLPGDTVFMEMLVQYLIDRRS